ncbi:hypothetical protein D3C79_595570 [compost metagenome]
MKSSTSTACRSAPSTVSTASSQPGSTRKPSASRGCCSSPWPCSHCAAPAPGSRAACCKASSEARRPPRRCRSPCACCCAWVACCSCSRALSRRSITCSSQSCSSSSSISLLASCSASSSMAASCGSLPSCSRSSTNLRWRSAWRSRLVSNCCRRACCTSAWRRGSAERLLKLSHCSCQPCMPSSASSSAAAASSAAARVISCSGSSMTSSSPRVASKVRSCPRCDSVSRRVRSASLKSSCNWRRRCWPCWMLCSTRAMSPATE